MKKIFSIFMVFVLFVTSTLSVYGMENEINSNYKLIETKNSEYGKIYYITSTNSEVEQYNLWDLVDILMAGSSWATFFNDPKWGNFGWAILDTVTLLPFLPSTAYFRKGSKTFIKVDELKKFANTPNGKQTINSVIRTYKYSDGITSSAVKAINKKFKGKEAETVLNLFKKAADKGLTGAQGTEGIKKLKGTYKNKYTHEIKIKSKQYGDYRIFGYQKDSGEWVFDLFDRGLH